MAYSSVSFRGFRFFSSPFLNSDIFTKLVICQPAELDLPCILELTIFPFEIVPPASSYSVPVTSTMRSSSFSYKFLPYILIHILVHAVRSIKSYRNNIQLLLVFLYPLKSLGVHLVQLLPVLVQPLDLHQLSEMIRSETIALRSCIRGL